MLRRTSALGWYVIPNNKKTDDVFNKFSTVLNTSAPIEHTCAVLMDTDYLYSRQMWATHTK